MQLRKGTWRRVALGALGLLFTACGSAGYDLTCSGDGDCLESEVCHENEKICVRHCMTYANCPPEATGCETLDTQKICKCPTRECVGGRDP